MAAPPCVELAMVAVDRTEKDPEYKKLVDAVVNLYKRGLSYTEIAKRTADLGPNVTKDQVHSIVRHQKLEPDVGARATDIDLREREDKALVMMAAGFKTYEIAKALRLTEAAVRRLPENREYDYANVQENWRSFSVRDGYAAREFRIRQLHDELLFFDEWIPEKVWVYEKEHKGIGKYIHQETGEQIQRKYDTDRYGRPVWTSLRLKLMDELAKLQGDHATTINVKKLDDEQAALVAALAQGHREILKAPAVEISDVTPTPAEFEVADASPANRV